jgi:hypothetical protein
MGNLHVIIVIIHSAHHLKDFESQADKDGNYSG